MTLLQQNEKRSTGRDLAACRKGWTGKPSAKRLARVLSARLAVDLINGPHRALLMHVRPGLCLHWLGPGGIRKLAQSRSLGSNLALLRGSSAICPATRRIMYENRSYRRSNDGATHHRHFEGFRFVERCRSLSNLPSKQPQAGAGAHR